MNYPRYPKYKDSGVEWLGDVPDGWDIVSLFSVAAERTQSNKGMAEQNLLSLSYGNIIRKDIESNDGLLPESFETYQIVEKNDIIFRLTDLQNDKRSLRTGIVKERGIITSAYTAMCTQKIDAEYFAYLLRAYDIKKIFYSMGGGLRQTLKYCDTKWLPILVPEPSAQQTIAAFLDHHCAKIDALIVEQEKLITLLREKRQAVISHAVTKGLNPDAPMKDSGMEWLGAVPEGWEIKKIKYIKAQQDNAFVDGPFGSNLKSEHFVDDGDIYVIESNFATQNKIEPDKLKTITNDHFQTIVRSEAKYGDIIIAKIGAKFGKSSILPLLDKRSVVSGNSLKLSVNNQICETNWAHLQLVNLKDNGEIDLLVNGSAQPALSLGGMNNLIFLLPPLPEQQAIVTYLDTETAKIDTLIAESEKAVALLKERRSALISAAVTGKIDVRNIPLQEAV